MKALPCQTADCSGAPRSNGIIQLSDGKPYLVGQCSGFPLVAKCSRCKRPSKFTAVQFARLPELTIAQLEELKALEPLTRDWVGSGLPREHAHDLIAAGLMGPGVVAHRPAVKRKPPNGGTVAKTKAKTHSTGTKCRLSGVYRSGRTTIPLSKGETFPPCDGEGAKWTLVR